MRFAFVLTILTASLLFWLARGVPATEPPAPTKPFGLDKRIPWTTSRVVGSPNPPLPYRVRRVFLPIR